MTGPYRDPGGMPCLRCGATLAVDDRSDHVCGDGCGTWLARAAVVALIGDAEPKSAKVFHWKVEALPATRCPVCSKPLVDHYVTAGDHAFALGRCAVHGIWLERATRADFEAACAPQIAKRAAVPPPPVPIDNAERIQQLEGRVAELERIVAWLSAVVREHHGGR